MLGLTIGLGVLVQLLYYRKYNYQDKFDKLFPFALVYFPTAIIYAFVADSLPLRLFSIEPIPDHPSASHLGPQSISGEAMVVVGIYILTIVINIVVWLLALAIIVMHFIKRRMRRVNE